MEHVKCKSCGKRHPLGECRGPEGGSERRSPQVGLPAPFAPGVKLPAEAGATPNEVEELRARIAELEPDAMAHRAYLAKQREVMRARRAAKRNEK